MAWAMLVMPSRVTMLGISRWAGKGGSDRTVQRLFSQALPWAMLCWVFFRQHVHRPMVNVACHLQADVRQRDPDDSILDLKDDGRGCTSVEETIKMLPEKPEPVL
jgi:hypothetical protein